MPTVAPSVSSQRAGEFALSFRVSWRGKPVPTKPDPETGRWPGEFGESYRICSSPPILLPYKSQGDFQAGLCLSPGRAHDWRLPFMAFVWSLCCLSPPVLLPMALARLCCSGCTALRLCWPMLLAHQFPPTPSSELKCHPPL